MSDHRIRLSDDEVLEVTAALRARVGMRRGERRAKLERLIERLEDGGRGNPNMRFGAVQTSS